MKKRGPEPVTRNSASDVEFPNRLLRSPLSSIWDVEFPNLLLRRFQASGSPFYVWLTIRLCIRHKKPLPDWVMAYLAQCADRFMSVHYAERRALCDRMKPTRYTEGRRLSGKTKPARDLRETFQRVFGFPTKEKNGPGSLFDPDAEAHIWIQKVVFALHFAERLVQGDDPVTARSNACDDFFAEVVDDRTLQRYLREVFDLTSLPSTIEEWKPVVDSYLVMLRKRHRETLSRI